jgi:hypothetical protein
MVGEGERGVPKVYDMDRLVPDLGDWTVLNFGRSDGEGVFGPSAIPVRWS